MVATQGNILITKNFKSMLGFFEDDEDG